MENLVLANIPAEQLIEELRREVEARKRAEEALRAADKAHAFVLKMSDAVRLMGDPIEIQQTAARILCEHLGVEGGAYYLEVGEDGDSIDSLLGYWTTQPLDLPVGSRISGLGEWFLEKYQNRESVVYSDVESDPRFDEATRAAYRSLNVRAGIGVPLWKGDRLVALFGVTNATLRDWTDGEVALVFEVAERTWAAVERAKAEQVARELDRRLRLLMESATEYSIFTTDRNGIVNSWNPGSARIYGYADEEIIGQDVAVLFTEEDRRRGAHLREQEIAVEHGRALDERWHLRKDGTTFFALGVAQPLGEGGSEGFVKISRDMTGRIRAEQALREKELMQKLVEAQEQERKRIARDLHDELGQQLTALRLKLDHVSSEAPGPLSEQVNEVQEIAKSIDEGVDFLAWELRPAALDDLGLVPAVEKYVKEWSNYSGVKGNVSASAAIRQRFEPAVETALYRIVQEALNNVNKHAKARNAQVSMKLRRGKLLLIVDDDGEGFDPKSATIRGRGIGLIGMKERAQMIGGSMEIESGIGHGTTLYIKAPMNGHAERRSL